MSSAGRRVMVISPLWLQGVILTFVSGFGILGYLALRVYEDHAPVPERIASEAGEEVFTREDILQGQVAFLTYGLMEYGSIYGHGAQGWEYLDLVRLWQILLTVGLILRQVPTTL